MVSTDPYRLIMERKEELDLTWQDLADRLRIKYPQNVMDAARRGNLPDSYVKLAEALGCDIVIQLKPRPSDPKAFAWKVSRGRKYERKEEKCCSGSLYGKNCYDVNNRQEPDKERK